MHDDAIGLRKIEVFQAQAVELKIFAGGEGGFVLALQLHAEHHDDIGPLRNLCDRADRQAGLAGLVARTTRRWQTDTNVHPTVTKVQRVRVPLRSVPYDCHFFGAYQGQISGIVIPASL